MGEGSCRSAREGDSRTGSVAHGGEPVGVGAHDHRLFHPERPVHRKRVRLKNSDSALGYPRTLIIAGQSVACRLRRYVTHSPTESAEFWGAVLELQLLKVAIRGCRGDRGASFTLLSWTLGGSRLADVGKYSLWDQMALTRLNGGDTSRKSKVSGTELTPVARIRKPRYLR